MTDESQPAQTPQQPGNLSEPFPPPPPFYKHFTAENVARVKKLHKQRQRDDSSQSNEQALSEQVPEHADKPDHSSRFLIPPPPPQSGAYRSFGDLFRIDETLPSLEEQGIQQLYPSSSVQGIAEGESTASSTTIDHAYYLKKVVKSLLLNFVELIGILSVNPSQFGSKFDDIRTLFINAHHLVNEYRPHQARETLILMMEEQLTRTRQEIGDMRKMKDKVDDVLASLNNIEIGEENSTSDIHQDDLSIHTQQKME